MEEIEGTYFEKGYFEFRFNGKITWVNFNIVYDIKKNRLEYHFDEKGIYYIVYWCL